MLFDSVYSRWIDICNSFSPSSIVHIGPCFKAAIQYVATQIQRMSISIKIVKTELGNYVMRFV